MENLMLSDCKDLEVYGEYPREMNIDFVLDARR